MSTDKMKFSYCNKSSNIGKDDIISFCMHNVDMILNKTTLHEPNCKSRYQESYLVLETCGGFDTSFIIDFSTPVPRGFDLEFAYKVLISLYFSP